ncbi:MAG TPA: hypothetical protein VEY91_13920 [Candidatus Limnocylindria bacterium]|nr:hypothetical protein [Candidatus Limnocylindria bacterium]
MARRNRRRDPYTPLAGLVGVALLAGACVIGFAPMARGQEATSVKLERIKPKKEKHATLQFLKDNRDFIRARFDLLRQQPVERQLAAAEIDPRYLGYRDMLASILAAKDSVAAAEDARQRRDLLASVTDLGDLESQLDLMERQLGQQRERLGVLQKDFTGDQQTALVVVVSGYPKDVALSEIAITLEDGDTLSVPLSAEQQTSLRQGGVVQVFHGFVEPREQIIEVGVTSDQWPSGDSGFLTLEPMRDRLTFLRLDLSTVIPVGGAVSISASTWLHDARIPSGDG